MGALTSSNLATPGGAEQIPTISLWPGKFHGLHSPDASLEGSGSRPHVAAQGLVAIKRGFQEGNRKKAT